MRQFTEELKRPNETIARFLAIHLYTEFWINRLIETKAPTGNEILSDPRAYTFSVKLTIVRNLDLIPAQLFGNIRVLNRIRNGYAHDLTFDFRPLLTEIRAWTPHIADRHALDLSEDKEAAKWIGLNTYVWLHAHCDMTHHIRQ